MSSATRLDLPIDFDRKDCLMKRIVARGMLMLVHRAAKGLELDPEESRFVKRIRRQWSNE